MYFIKKLPVYLFIVVRKCKLSNISYYCNDDFLLISKGAISINLVGQNSAKGFFKDNVDYFSNHHLVISIKRFGMGTDQASFGQIIIVLPIIDTEPVSGLLHISISSIGRCHATLPVLYAANLK